MTQQSQAPNRSYLDSEPIKSFIEDLILRGETNAFVARAVSEQFDFQTTDDSIRRFRKRHGIQVPGVEREYTKIQGDKGEAAMPVEADGDGNAILTDPDAMLRERGFAPEEWEIDNVGANQWQGPSAEGGKTTYRQVKFSARKKRPDLTIVPARSDGWRPPERPKRVVKGEPELVVIVGDQHAPFHDEHLHGLFCEWLEDWGPHRGIELGDLPDFPDISRHPKDPENHAKANECLQSSYDILRAYVEASPSTDWDYLLGNHDERIRQYLLKNAPLAYDLKQVDTSENEGERVHTLSHLMRLDELGVNIVDPMGTYEDAQVALGQNLAVRHGWIVRQGSGASALKTLETTGYSILVGHTHRQSTVYHTFHEITRKPRQLLAAEIGCMCRIDGRPDPQTKRRYPNYATHADWQQGFATAEIWPDGKFKVDLATYVNGVLLWRDSRYE